MQDHPIIGGSVTEKVPQHDAADVRQIAVTRGGAFAVGMVAVSALALAFALGRQLPPKNDADYESGTSGASLAEAQMASAMTYDQLTVDRGTAASVVHRANTGTRQ